MAQRRRVRSTSAPTGPLTKQSNRRTLAGVILCGGKGKRMGRTLVHKACVPIAGRPAVVRLIDTLRADGIDPLVVVVGHQACEVVETIGAAHPGIHFVYQRDQLGTGHAARIGVEALCQFAYDGPILLTMGDKWFAPGLIRNVLRRFYQSRADMLAVSTPKRPGVAAGRLVHIPARGIVGIVELRDIQRAHILKDWLTLASSKNTLTKSLLRQRGLKWIQPTTKLWRALGPLAQFSRGSGNVQPFELIQYIHETGLAILVGGVELTPEQVEQYSGTANEAIYIAQAGALQSALRRVGRDNAQDEYYLTDVIEIIAEGRHVPHGKTQGKIVEHRLDPTHVMAFNTRAELRRIEKHVQHLERDREGESADRRLVPSLKTPSQWHELLDPTSTSAQRWGEHTYGIDGSLAKERLRALRSVVRLFGQTNGHEHKLFLVRAPGRLNLMGRHIDHQGGLVHAIALDCEIVLAVSRRKDNVIRLVNADPVAFPPRELVLSDWTAALQAPDWLSFVESQAVRTHLMSTVGDWSNYVLAAALYQQYHHSGRRLRGMNVVVSGNVPMAVGLASSSSLVVASMEAITAVNGIRASAAETVAACGQAEWFVGSRGGSADHAAIHLGRAGYAARMEFHPFRLTRYIPIPDQAALLIAYSGEHAIKGIGVLDRFNERVACYQLGMLLLQHQYPQLAPKLQYVRDLLPSHLGVSTDDVLKMTQTLPTHISRRQLRRRLGPESADPLNRIFTSHADSGEYTIRDVVTYGIGECERSRIAAKYLERHDLAGFGELMLRSHDGDRVSGTTASENYASLPAGRKRIIPPHMLVGAYGCSTKSIDQLVDIARSLPGVYGAQLAGAGLGGCVMILTQRSAASRIKTALAKAYYQPRARAATIWQVRSVSAGGLDAAQLAK